MTPAPLRLVIFDCDGVLVDSEGPANRVVAEEATKLGLPMDEAESTRLFMGFRLSDIPPVIEARIGRPVPPGWVEMLRGRLIESFADVRTIPGARTAVEAALALGLRVRVASNSSHEEMAVKFATTGLDALLGERRHSARDVARGKPAPDVFLAAAAAEGVPPEASLVVEDSVPGVTGAVAAGMAVVGLAPHGDGAALRSAGARTIRHLDELRPLLEAAMRRPA
jgi:beta-phosphoglucomutase-like phosphatase (HAD superfamily)